MSIRLGAVRPVAAIGLLCLICLVIAGPARAQTIGAGSCVTSDGSSACAPDPGLGSVGAGSCAGFASPCSADPALISVGNNSCDNSDTFDPFSNCSNDPLLVAVADNSCDQE